MVRLKPMFSAFAVSVALMSGYGAQAQNAAGPSAMPSLPPTLREKLADAKPGDLRVVATAAMYLPIEAVRQEAQRAAGKPVRIQYGSARGDLKTLIAGGQPFDLAILLPDVIQDPSVSSKVDPHVYRIAAIPVAIGLRGDAPAPDVRTPAALRTALLKARSVKYAPTGAARGAVDRVFSSLGVTGQIKDVSATPAPVELAPGEYEINFFPISEILQNRGLKNLGLVPEPLQVPAQIEAVIARDADSAAAQAFLKILQGPSIEPALKSSGMIRPQ